MKAQFMGNTWLLYIFMAFKQIQYEIFTTCRICNVWKLTGFTSSSSLNCLYCDRFLANSEGQRERSAGRYPNNSCKESTYNLNSNRKFMDYGFKKGKSSGDNMCSTVNPSQLSLFGIHIVYCLHKRRARKAIQLCKKLFCSHLLCHLTS